MATSNRQIDPQAEAERITCEHAEALTAWEKSTAEAEDKPPFDYYAMEAADYRKYWIMLWSEHFDDFEDTTKIPPMRFTKTPAPQYTSPIGTLQIFSVKIIGVRDGLPWPLHVYGMVALRDAVDRRRNIIFNRKRDNCQILTQEYPYLALTGPTRAVVMMRPVTFEVELRVKGTDESEDKDLSYLATPLTHPVPLKSCLLITNYPSKLSTVEFKHGHLCSSVEATVSMQVTNGSWFGYRGKFFVRAASLDEEVILLDSGDEEMPIAGRGKIELSRKVVCVENRGELNVFVKSWHDNNFLGLKVQTFSPKEFGRSHGKVDVGFCKMKVTVAWSLVSRECNILKGC